MGFLKKLFGGSDYSETTNNEQNTQFTKEVENKAQFLSAQNKDVWEDFFGINLKNAPNSDWDETEGEYNSDGQPIRNFDLYDLPDSYFIEIGAKVIGKNATNFFFTCPYTHDDAFDIYFIIERDLIHNGRYTNSEAARQFRGKFDNEYDMINWDDINGCSIMMSRDMDTGDIKLGVWTDFYNTQYLDEENPIDESNITSQESDNDDNETEDSEDNSESTTKLISIHLPKSVNMLKFLRDHLQSQMDGDPNTYYLQPIGSTIHFLDITTFEEIISFECKEVTDFLEGRMAAATLTNVEGCDTNDIRADILVTPEGKDEDSEDNEENGNPTHVYYEMSYLVDPEEIDYRRKTIMDGTINFSVVGMQHRDNYEKLKEIIEEGTLVVLKPEPDNPYDPNALAFYLKDGTLIGYLPKKDQPFARIFLAKGFINGTISKIDDKWVDTEVLLAPEMVNKSALGDEKVFVSRITSYGYMNERSKLVDITEIFDKTESNDDLIPEKSTTPIGSKLDEYYKQARQARENGDGDDAETYYKKILPYSPNDWETNFFLAYIECIHTSINEICLKVTRFREKLIKIFVYMIDIEDKKKMNEVLKEIFECSFSICTQYFNLTINHFESIDGEDIDDDDKKIFRLNCNLTASLIHYLGDEMKDRSADDLKDLALKAWEEGNNDYIKYAKTMYFIGDDEKQEIINTVNEYVAKIREYRLDAINPLDGDPFFD